MARSTSGEHDDLEYARSLADHLRRGGALQQVPAPFRMRPGEFAVATTDVVVHQVVEGDGSYVRKSGGYVGGGVVGLAALAALSAAGNARRRARAAREAAASWRPVEQSRMTLTTERIVLQGREWTDLWHGALNVAEAGSAHLELQYSGIPPLRLELRGPRWYQVMVQHLAWDELPDL